MAKQKKTIYYTDELNDDFAKPLKVKQRVISGDYKYLFGKNPFKHVLSFILYRLLATPLVLLYMKLFKGLKIKNRKAVKKIKGGYFVYVNHTQYLADAFTPTLVNFPKRAKVLVHPNAVSIPCISGLVAMLGAMPVPSDISATRNLLAAMKTLLNKKHAFVIYPEAHIWPYYNDIRPFNASSFYYPIKFGVPAVAYTVTYRRRKIFKNLSPLITVTVGEPVFPDEFTTKKELRDRIYGFMKETVKKEDSYEYIKYVKKDTADENNGCV